MKKYKALLRNKHTGEYELVILECETKTYFVNEMRRNGYGVNPYKVKEESVWDFIVDRTNAQKEHWENIHNENDVAQYKKHGEAFIQQKEDEKFYRKFPDLRPE